MSSMIVLFQPAPVFFLPDPEDLHPPNATLHAYADPKVGLVVRSLLWGQVPARPALERRGIVQPRNGLAHHNMFHVTIAAQVVAVKFSRICLALAPKVSRKHRCLILYILKFCQRSSEWAVLCIEYVEACSVLYLDGFGLGLGEVVRLSISDLLLSYGLLGGVDQSD